MKHEFLKIRLKLFAVALVFLFAIHSRAIAQLTVVSGSVTEKIVAKTAASLFGTTPIAEAAKQELMAVTFSSLINMGIGILGGERAYIAEAIDVVPQPLTPDELNLLNSELKTGFEITAALESFSIPAEGIDFKISAQKLKEKLLNSVALAYAEGGNKGAVKAYLKSIKMLIYYAEWLLRNNALRDREIGTGNLYALNVFLTTVNSYTGWMFGTKTAPEIKVVKPKFPLKEYNPSRIFQIVNSAYIHSFDTRLSRAIINEFGQQLVTEVRQSVNQITQRLEYLALAVYLGLSNLGPERVTYISLLKYNADSVVNIESSFGIATNPDDLMTYRMNPLLYYRDLGLQFADRQLVVNLAPTKNADHFLKNYD
jgi:hypothetical protein